MSNISAFQLVDAEGTFLQSESFRPGTPALLFGNGGTVCRAGFTQNSADAVFKSLGYSGPVTWFYEKRWSSQDNHSIMMRNVQCSSDRWESCSFIGDGSGCSHSDDVFLIIPLVVGNLSPWTWYCQVSQHMDSTRWPQGTVRRPREYMNFSGIQTRTQQSGLPFSR